MLGVRPHRSSVQSATRRSALIFRLISALNTDSIEFEYYENIIGLQNIQLDIQLCNHRTTRFSLVLHAYRSLVCARMRCPRLTSFFLLVRNNCSLRMLNIHYFHLMSCRRSTVERRNSVSAKSWHYSPHEVEHIIRDIQRIGNIFRRLSPSIGSTENNITYLRGEMRIILQSDDTSCGCGGRSSGCSGGRCDHCCGSCRARSTSGMVRMRMVV